MKISLDWLRQYITLPETPDEVAALLTGSGLEVESVDPLEAIPGGLEGVVIGQVLTCEKHPDADKLSITTVDVGGPEPLPIVCGAPNVAAGQKVVVATVGTTLHPTSTVEKPAAGTPAAGTPGEPFQIKKAKIRGAVSEGMICAEDEIGLGTSHAGILVLTTDLPNGTPAAKYFGLEADFRLEIGLTPNRADAASHVGVARDLKALLGREIHLPAVDAFRVEGHQFPIQVTVGDSTACPRFCGVTIDGLKVGSSPEWLQKRLRAIGLNPINNVVDVTNFVNHELGQPLHAYDWQAIKGQQIIVRYAPEGSVFTTLDGVERKLSAQDLMICNAEAPMGIGGIFGGKTSGVQPETTRVYLECAYFAPESIRRTAQRHGLKTDASFRFERGTDPNAKLYALKRAALLIQEVAGGKIASEVLDFYPQPVKNLQIECTYRNIDRLIGKKLGQVRIRTILESLDIRVWQETTEGFTASVPPYRVDVQREADVVEEILRIYGLNNVELSPGLRTDFLAQFPEKDANQLQYRTTQLLAGVGFQEIFTNSLTKPAYATALPAEALPGENVQILNALSEDLSVMRQTMLFSGLEALAFNINRRQRDLKFFEFGKTYHKRAAIPTVGAPTGTKYLERQHLVLFLTGNASAETWQQASRPVAFHDAVSAVSHVLTRLNVRQFDTQDVTIPGPFAYGLTYLINKKEVVSLGLVKNTLTKLTDLKQPVFYVDFDWDYLFKLASTDVVFQEIPKFPEVRRDLSLVLDKTVSFREIRQLAEKYERNLLRSVNVFDVYEGQNIGADKKAYAVSFVLQDAGQTLTEPQIDRAMQRLMAGFEKELGAVIRK
ncbi:MAG: phenylalanine--tRNA ligase subunit beta [Cytophagaceae bacterium]|nr:phenylalanine--tRNA ligase subunit beta [Cytophagaceae bacterium]